MVIRRPKGDELRERLRDGRIIGTFVKLPATEAIDIVAGAGFDFALIDLEHSQLTEGDALRLTRHAAALDLPAVIRIPTVERGFVNRVLEAGASGIQLSTVLRVADVQALITATRYSPYGTRSVSLAHPMAGYGSLSLRQATGTPHPLLVGQIETATTEDPLGEILRAGLDVAFIGVTDLLVDVGYDQERHDLRVRQIASAVADAGIPLGVFAADGSALGAGGDGAEGARYVALSSDLALLKAAAVRMVRDVR